MTKSNAPATPETPEFVPPPPTADTHDEQALDEALDESFPSSDPIAISVPKPERPPKG